MASKGEVGIYRKQQLLVECEVSTCNTGSKGRKYLHLTQMKNAKKVKLGLNMRHMHAERLSRSIMLSTLSVTPNAGFQRQPTLTW